MVDGTSVTWPLPSVQSMHPMIRGGRAQWAAQYGDRPPLLDLLAANEAWFFAWIRAHRRACAGSALHLFTRFNEEFATITGCHGRFDERRAPQHQAPAARLVWGELSTPAHRALQKAFTRVSASERQVLEPLLEAAFGQRASCALEPRMRARICALGTPAVLAASWRDTQSLAPPVLFENPAQLAAHALVQTAFADREHVAPVSAEQVQSLPLAAWLPGAIDAIATILTVRVTLAAAGLLAMGSPALARPDGSVPEVAA